MGMVYEEEVEGGDLAWYLDDERWMRRVFSH